MRAVASILVVLVLMLIVGGLTMVAISVGAAVRRRSMRPGITDRVVGYLAARRARREAAERARVPWEWFSTVDPVTGDRLIGIQRVYRAGAVERVVRHRVPLDDPRRWELEAEAMIFAGECNNITGGGNGA